LTATTDQIAADAKAVIDLDGEAITYTQGATPYSINAIPQSLEVQPDPAIGRKQNTQKLVLAIAKSDIAAVKINADTVTVPASWFKKGSGTVTARVAAVTGDDADPGMWLIHCRFTS
jgi:hypothetical protein